MPNNVQWRFLFANLCCLLSSFRKIPARLINSQMNSVVTVLKNMKRGSYAKVDLLTYTIVSSNSFGGTTPIVLMAK